MRRGRRRGGRIVVRPELVYKNFTILDKVPVDSFHDVDGAKGGDSRVVLWGLSLFEDQECVSVNSCLCNFRMNRMIA